jgi:hypothetical protein
MSAEAPLDTEGPLLSTYQIAEANANQKAAHTVADWARRTHHSNDALLEVIEILGIGESVQH